jgi:hypothetical protein
LQQGRKKRKHNVSGDVRSTDAGYNPRDLWDEHLSECRSGTSTMAA